MPTFTQDWFSAKIPMLKEVLEPRFKGRRETKGLEIGAFEGRSTCWLMDNILTGVWSNLVVIDPWERAPFDDGYDLAKEYDDRLRAHVLFLKNTEPYRVDDRIRIEQSTSQVALSNYGRLGFFDFAYVDGDHRPHAVMTDAVLAFLALKKGGILAFDDYTFTWPDMSPTKNGIDGFLLGFKDRIKVLHVGVGVAVEKL